MNEMTVLNPTTNALSRNVAGGANHPVDSYLARLGESSRRAMMTALRCAYAVATEISTYDVDFQEVRNFNWAGIRRGNISALKSALAAAEYAPNYRRKILSAVRGVMEEASVIEGSGITPIEFAQAWHRQRVTGSSLPAGRDISDGEKTAIAKACREDKSPAGARDGSIIGWGFTQGPRISEVRNADLEDYNPKTSMLVIRNGKGGKERTNYILNGARRAIDVWLVYRGSNPGPLFCPIDRDDHRVIISRLSTTSLAKILQKRQLQANVEYFTFHDLRRTYIGDALEAGTDLVTVQKTVGHADPRTTARYDRRPEGAKAEAAGRLHFPY